MPEFRGTFQRLALDDLLYKLEAFAEPPKNAPGRERWTDEQERLLAEMWARGCQYRQISKAVGHGQRATIDRRWRLGLPRSKSKYVAAKWKTSGETK